MVKFDHHVSTASIGKELTMVQKPGHAPIFDVRIAVESLQNLSISEMNGYCR